MHAKNLPASLARIGAALSSQSDPLISLEEVVSVFQLEIGYLLCTVSMVEPVHGLTTTRLWSSEPTVYPIGETKPMESGAWAEHIAQRRPVVCHEPNDIKTMFSGDYDALTKLSCGSGVNLPVFLANRLIGSINLFHKTGWFTPQRVAHCQSLATLIYAPLLLFKEKK